MPRPKKKPEEEFDFMDAEDAEIATSGNPKADQMLMEAVQALKKVTTDEALIRLAGDLSVAIKRRLPPEIVYDIVRARSRSKDGCDLDATALEFNQTLRPEIIFNG